MRLSSPKTPRGSMKRSGGDAPFLKYLFLGLLALQFGEQPLQACKDPLVFG